MVNNKDKRVFVYVIGLHAVQFGNNWMKKFRGQPKLDEAESNKYIPSRSRDFLHVLALELLRQIFVSRTSNVRGTTMSR